MARQKFLFFIFDRFGFIQLCRNPKVTLVHKFRTRNERDEGLGRASLYNWRFRRDGLQACISGLFIIFGSVFLHLPVTCLWQELKWSFFRRGSFSITAFIEHLTGKQKMEFDSVVRSWLGMAALTQTSALRKMILYVLASDGLFPCNAQNSTVGWNFEDTIRKNVKWNKSWN